MADASATHGELGAGVAIVTLAADRNMYAAAQWITAVVSAAIIVVAIALQALLTLTFLVAVIAKTARVSIIAGCQFNGLCPCNLAFVNVADLTGISGIGVTVNQALIENKTMAISHYKVAAADTVAFVIGARAIIVTRIGRAFARPVYTDVILRAGVVVRTGDPLDAGGRHIFLGGVLADNVGVISIRRRAIWTGSVR